MRLFYTLLLLFFGLSSLIAQSGKGWMIEPTFRYGKLLKHTPKLNFDVEEPSYAFQIDVKKQTLGEKKWHQLQGFPLFGVSAMYYKLGDSDILGSAFSIAPNVNVYLFRKNKFDGHFHFGYGLAYLTKHFDFNKNPINNAIGSAINVNVQIDFDFHYHYSKHWSLKTGGSFTHYSNGAASLPNFGLNIVGGMIGLRYRPIPITDADYKRDTEQSPKALKRFGLDLNLGIGYKERGSFGGPKNPVYILSTAATYHTNKINRVLLGGEMEFNKGVYLFGKHIGEFTSEEEARRRSMRFSLFVGDELLFGDFGISMQLGLYLHDVYLGVFPVYNRFVVRYYFPPVGRPAGRFYAALQLKSHLIIAEYFSVMGGVRF